MKCEELKQYEVFVSNPYNAGGNLREIAVLPADKVDEAIAELKDVIHELQVDLEGAKATAYADGVDANMENRELKRALWMARAYRAEARKNYWYARSCHEDDEHLWSIDGSAVKYIGCIKRTNFDWLKVWSEIEIKCLKKAKEYRL